ncbi:cation channel sperm-associated auxiliary subunit beta-like [Salvelinus fontinalis]|uniref:cation channel sperm-associated auxiliary subunit beta-like n=1 Tax=Salvelinus fontinalis TaxID=8038 RepID=UPI002485F24B|nr:cation channel sperm-associated auxiliary subunit beta-like [Salvelinus fontinalis]
MKMNSIKVTQIIIILFVGIQFGTTISDPDDRDEPNDTDEPDDPEQQKLFRCVSGNMDSKRIRLYLGLDNLVVDCMLQKKPGVSAIQYRNQLKLYTSSGLLPTMVIYNSTNSATFPFKLIMNASTWRVNVPRYNITIHTVAAPVDEWYVEFSMFHGSSMFISKGSILDTLKGTLLDVAREPILQWPIGEELSSRIIEPHLHRVLKLQVSQSPCAGDVAVLAPVFAPGGHTGVILSVTRSAFTAQARWFNATRSLCSLINEVCVSGCAGISIVDLKLTNCHLFLLTNRGLFISQDLLSPVTGTLNFTLLFLPALAQMDYSATTLWFSSQCVTDRIYFSDDTLSLISNEGEGENLHSRCVYSKYPFTRWFLCQASAADIAKNPKHRYLSFLHDRHQHTGLLLSHTEQKGAMVSVFGVKVEDIFQRHTKFPPVILDFQPRGIFLSDNHVILYGSEVWTSSDRGSTFTWVFSLDNQMVIDALSCTVNGVVVFFTDHGNLYIMKSGLARFAWLNETLDVTSTLLCGHMGILIAVQLDKDKPSGFSYRNIEIDHLIEKHEMGFDKALALQYLTDHTVLLHENAVINDHANGNNRQGRTNPLTVAPASHFSPNHVGKVIYFSDGGMVVITEVFRTHYHGGFSGAIVGEILEPIKGASLNAEPMQLCDLLVKTGEPEGLIVTLQLKDLDPSQGFNLSHVGKAVVAPGFSSYLITGLVHSGSALAKPTMPALVLPLTSHRSGEWLLFHSAGRGSWGMKEGLCRHTLQSLDGVRNNALIRINVREELNFTFKAFMSDYSLSMVYHKKFMRVVLTNPLAFRVTARHSWDDTNNHILTLTAFSHLCKKATTIVMVYIPEASLLCRSSSFTFTLQNSCPEGLQIVYVSQQPISDHEWIHTDPVDHMNNKRLFNLPVNYRPPSQLGVLIPTTDNIYNADPSHPHPRQHFPISKNSGRYKQCAGKRSAEECGCTDRLKVSPLAINSDCRQRVLRLTFPVTDFNITLFLRRTNHADHPLCSPYFVTVTEVNNRTSWKVTGTHATPTMDRMRQYFEDSLKNNLYNPEGLQISFYGSELFHFRISVIPGVVLCDLVEEVQIYVDEPPLAFPTQHLVNNMTAIILGGLLLVGFLLIYNGVAMPTKSSIKTLLKKHKPTISPTRTQNSTTTQGHE